MRKTTTPNVKIGNAIETRQRLCQALDQARKSQYAGLRGKDRSVIKGQKYTLLSHRDNSTPQGRRSLHKLLQANHRLKVAIR